MTVTKQETLDALSRLEQITRQLRRECPWDREQDERSIVPHTVEEAYELAAAAQSGDDRALLDELGDVLFQVYFLALLMEERNVGSLAEVADRCREKLIRRHPHIFPAEPDSELTKVSGSSEVLANWDQIKRTERGENPPIFADVPEILPGLLYSRKLLRRVASTGFDFDHVPYEGVVGELQELEKAQGRDEQFHEMGDLLLAVVNVARKLKVDPELSLRAASERFRKRVDTAAEIADAEGVDFTAIDTDQQLTFYAKAKLDEC